MNTQPALFDPIQTTSTSTTPPDLTAASAPRSTWLEAHLIRAGHLTETGLTRAARIHTCTCRATTIAGLDGDVLAFEAHTDPQPLSVHGEAFALLEGRVTWHLRRERNRYVLEPRDSYDIRRHPATSRPREDVLRQHRCHTAPLDPTGPLVAPSRFPETTPRLPAGAAPPF